MLALVKIIQCNAQPVKVFFHASEKRFKHKPAGHILLQNLFRGHPCSREHLLLVASGHTIEAIDAVDLNGKYLIRLALAVAEISNIPHVNIELFLCFPAERHARCFSGFDVTARAAPALPIRTLSAEDFPIVQDKAGNITAFSFIRNQVACCRRVLRIGRLGNVSPTQAPVLIDIHFRDDVFRVKLFILCQRPANLVSFQDASGNVCGSRLCSGKLGRSIRLILRSLFIVRQAPSALVGNGILWHLIDFTVPRHSAQNQFDQRAGVVPEVTGLDAGHGLLVVFHISFTRGIFASRGAPKEPCLRNMAHSGQHGTGIVQNVLDSRRGQGLNANILAICINEDHVQQITGKVKHLHTLKNRIVTVYCRQDVCEILHFVCHH